MQGEATPPTDSEGVGTKVDGEEEMVAMLVDGEEITLLDGGVLGALAACAEADVGEFRAVSTEGKRYDGDILWAGDGREKMVEELVVDLSAVSWPEILAAYGLETSAACADDLRGDFK